MRCVAEILCVVLLSAGALACGDEAVEPVSEDTQEIEGPPIGGFVLIPYEGHMIYARLAPSGAARSCRAPNGALLGPETVCDWQNGTRCSGASANCPTRPDPGVGLFEETCK